MSPHTGQGVEIVFLGAGSSTLEIFYYADPAKRVCAPLGRLNHTAWYVDDVKATMARLAAEGATFRPKDPAPTSDGGLMAFTTGPDGERVELTQRP
ncbi:MAG: VOC family protein [Bacillota bacterium]